MIIYSDISLLNHLNLCNKHKCFGLRNKQSTQILKLGKPVEMTVCYQQRIYFYV